MSPSNTNTRDIRQNIVDKSRDRFLTYGFSSVTLDEIASELRMSKKTFYNYFSSKEDLLRAAIFEMLEDAELRMKGVVYDDELDFTGKLRGILTVASGILSRIGKPFTRDIARSAPDTWKEIQEFRQKRLLSLFFRLLKAGQVEGKIRTDIDQEMVIVLFNHVFERVINPEVISNLPYTAGQVFDHLMDILFAGILSDDFRSEYLQRTATESVKHRRSNLDA